MSLLTLAYPQLSQRDFEWIEVIRSRHNQHDIGLVKPHLTLVFETERLSSDQLAAHIHSVVSDTPPVDMVFRSVMIMPGIVCSETYLFLVPEEGFSAVAGLHDRLYSDKLAADLRLDIPYVPHMTLGRFADGRACQKVATELSLQPIAIEARIETVDLVDFDGAALRTIQQFPLSGA